MIQNTVDLRFLKKKKSGRATNWCPFQTISLLSSSTVDFLNRFFLKLFLFLKDFLRRKECFLNCMGAIVFLMF